MTRHDLITLALAFTEAFNRDDLDAAMQYFTEDATYEEFNGRSHTGKGKIRQAFLPQFRGDHGAVRFEVSDCFADGEAGRVLIAWVCRVEGKPGGWHGLDVLHVRDGKISRKHTYAKARAPLVE